MVIVNASVCIVFVYMMYMILESGMPCNEWAIQSYS